MTTSNQQNESGEELGREQQRELLRLSYPLDERRAKARCAGVEPASTD
jgi:hypothetical protein